MKPKNRRDIIIPISEDLELRICTIDYEITGNEIVGGSGVQWEIVDSLSGEVMESSVDEEAPGVRVEGNKLTIGQ